MQLFYTFQSTHKLATDNVRNPNKEVDKKSIVTLQTSTFTKLRRILVYNSVVCMFGTRLNNVKMYSLRKVGLSAHCSGRELSIPANLRAKPALALLTVGFPKPDRSKITLAFKIGQISCLETSVTRYQSTLRNI